MSLVLPQEVKINPLFERKPHGIFPAGGAYMPTQEKKKKINPLFHNVEKWPNLL